MHKKAGIRKKVSHKKTSAAHHSEYSHPHDVQVEKVLVENFVALQKVMTNLSIKFDNLSTQISKLLELFEISAKTMAQKDFELGRSSKEEKEMVKKMDDLLEQNKVIARGLTLLHEPSFKSNAPIIPRSVPPQLSVASMEEKPLLDDDIRNYQKSRSLGNSPKNLQI